MQLAGVADAAGRELNQPSLVQTFLNIVPKNPFGAISGGKILPTIFAAMLFGIGLAYLRESTEDRIKNAAETSLPFSKAVPKLCIKWFTGFSSTHQLVFLL